MMCRRIGSCGVGVALLLALGGLVLALPALARTGTRPCSLVSVEETEALTGEKVVKSVERVIPRANGAGYDAEGVRLVCQRWLAGGRVFRLTVGPGAEEANAELAGDVLSGPAPQAITDMGGTSESKQFGEITCTTVIVPSRPDLDTTTCAAVKIPLYYGDGFDRTAAVVKEPLRITLQITAGPEGLVPVDAVHALAEKAFARLP